MSTVQLGPLQREFSATAQGRNEVSTGGVLLLVILGIGAFAITHCKPGQFWMGVGLIGVLSAGLLVYIYAGYCKLDRRVRLHSNGMILQDGGEKAVVPWDDIVSLSGLLPVSFRGVPVHIGGPMQITLRDGRRFRLGNGNEDLDVLASFLHEKVLSHLLPPVRDALQRDETVTLGALRVDRSGLHVANNSLPWSEFEGVSFTTANLLILQRGASQPWQTLKIAEIPNANLFLHLARSPQLV